MYKCASSVSFLEVLEQGGYLTAQGYDHKPLRQIIPNVKQLVETFYRYRMLTIFTRESHRPNLSTLSHREHFRSRNNASGIGIGDKTARLGRALIRGEPGCGIVEELWPYDTLSISNVVDKPGRSAFAHTELELILRNKDIKNLVICGVTTDVCVHTTMREANDRGFDCVLVHDACAAGTPELHDWAIDSIKSEGGIFGSVTTATDVLEALQAIETD